MFVDERGLNLDDKELRSFLVMVVGLLNWKCRHTCSECFFQHDDGCVIFQIRDQFDELFKGLVL